MDIVAARRERAAIIVCLRFFFLSFSREFLPCLLFYKSRPTDMANHGLFPTLAVGPFSSPSRNKLFTRSFLTQFTPLTEKA